MTVRAVFSVFAERASHSFQLFGETTVANKDQNKGKAKNNAPKLTTKQKKEKRAKKEAEKRAQGG